MSLYSIPAIIFVIVTFTIYIPIILYSSYPLYKNKHTLILKKRHVDLTLLIIKLQIINVAIWSLTQLLLFYSDKDQDKDDDDNNAQVTDFEIKQRWFWALLSIGIISLQFTLQVTNNIFLIRHWIFFYNIQHNNLLKSNEWKHVISQNHNISNSFYIKYKPLFGNKKLLKNINWILGVIISGISLTLSIYDFAGKQSLIVTESLMLLFLGGTFTINMACFFISSIIIFFKLRSIKFHDDLYIFQELVVFFKIIILGFIIYFLIACISGIVAQFTASTVERLENDENVLIVSYFILINVYIIFYIILIYVMSRYIISKLQKDEALRLEYGERLSIFNDSNSNHLKNNITNSINNNKQEISVFNILSNKEYIESFMAHLSREFSMEILLALIEFVQFRQNLLDHIHDDNNINHQETEEELLEIQFPSTIPESSIVKNKSYNDKERAHALYQKYIAVGSDYEINISSRLRNELSEKFDGADGGIFRTLSNIIISDDNNNDHDEESDHDDDLAFIFDKCSIELLRLLRYSLSRWRSKPEWIKLERYHNDES